MNGILLNFWIVAKSNQTHFRNMRSIILYKICEMYFMSTYRSCACMCMYKYMNTCCTCASWAMTISHTCGHGDYLLFPGE